MEAGGSPLPSGLETIAKLSSVEAEIALSEIYAGIQFPPEEEQLF